jgi:hypothetical protein
MRVKTWGIFIFLATAFRMQAQDAITDTSAQQVRNAGDLQKALELLRSDLRKDPQQYQTSYFLACDYALLGLKDSAFYYLDKAVEIRESFEVLTNPDLISLIKEAHWKKLTNQIAKSYFKLYPHYDKATTLLLAQMRMFNKAYDWDILRLESGSPKDSVLILHYHHLKDSLNEITRRQLEKIIINTGWPKSTAVGTSGVETAFLILQLADEKKQEEAVEPDVQSSAKTDKPLFSDTIPIERFVRAGLIPYQLFSRSSGAYFEFPMRTYYSLEGRVAYTYCQPEMENQYQYSLVVRGYFLYSGENAYLAWCARPGKHMKISMLLAQRYWEYHNQWLPGAAISIPVPDMYEERKSSYLFGVGWGIGLALDFAKRNSFVDAEFFMNAFIFQCWIHDLYSSAEGSTAPPQPPFSYAFYPREVSLVTRQPVVAVGLKLGCKRLRR